MNELDLQRVRRTLLIGGAIFCGSFLLGVLVSATAGIPIPRVHDEFSYLLAADTFIHGRLTNPTHPLWEFFETPHVIHRPTYQSKYPPGQGLALAAGQVIWHPILGVWLVTAAAITAVFLCLTRWLPVPWSVAGAVITALHPMVLRWMQCYWGGSVALLGGALVVGALRRADKYDLVIAAVGALILANSRPYEGLVLMILACPLLLRRLNLRTAAVAVIVLVAGFGWMAYYNNRVTGNPFQFPYTVHQRQYAVVPLFEFQQLQPEPPYRHERLREFYARWAVAEFHQRTTGEKLMRLVRGAFRLFLPSMDGDRFTAPFPPIYLSAVLLVPLIGAILAARHDRWIAAALAMLVLFGAALAPLTWLLPHYAAPAAPLLIILLTAGLMLVWQWRVVVIGFLVIWIASAAVSVWIMRMGQPGVGVWSEAAQRHSIQQRLTRSGEKHLVVVRCPPRAFLHFDWVANEADIDDAPVVWAREMRDHEPLLQYFRSRTVWLLDASVAPPRMLRQQ